MHPGCCQTDRQTHTHEVTKSHPGETLKPLVARLVISPGRVRATRREEGQESERAWHEKVLGFPAWRCQRWPPSRKGGKRAGYLQDWHF